MNRSFEIVVNELPMPVTSHQNYIETEVKEFFDKIKLRLPKAHVQLFRYRGGDSHINFEFCRKDAGDRHKWASASLVRGALILYLNNESEFEAWVKPIEEAIAPHQ